MYLIFNGHAISILRDLVENCSMTLACPSLDKERLCKCLWFYGWAAFEIKHVTNIVLKKPGKVGSIMPTWGKSLRFLGHIVLVIIIVILIASCFFLWHAWPGWIRNREAGKNTIKQKLKHYHFFGNLTPLLLAHICSEFRGFQLKPCWH